MKDPAFPFYAQDFLTGVMHFTMAERGMFITLLSYQWSHGRIPKDRLGLILGSGWEAHWPAVSEKFTMVQPGFLSNARLEEERTKRAQFKLKQSENGRKGGRKPKTDVIINPEENHDTSQLPTQKKPLENEGEEEYEKEYAFENGKEGMGEKPDDTIVMPYTGNDFAAQWLLWKNYRAKQHRFTYHSPESEQAALINLNELATGNEKTAIAIMHQSIAKGWKGFFELKTAEHGTAKPAATKGKVRYSDDFKQKIAQRLQSG